jgi:general stress protein 26
MKLADVMAMLEETSFVMLATLEGDRPAARTMTLVKNDGGLYMLTDAESPKVRQLRGNPRCLVHRELSAGENNGYITLDCLAEEEADPASRKRLYDAVPYAGRYWSSPEDPGYGLLKLTPTGGRVMKPGEMYAERIEPD